MLRAKGIDCRTVHEWIVGTKQKTRIIEDWEVRKFLGDRMKEGEAITLITNDEDSMKQVRADGIQAIYLPELVRDYVLSRE